jgi:Phage protein (N4 Gp49/phage Sf6 gene 66) family
MTEALLDIEEPTTEFPGPRITPELVEAEISSTYYFTAAQGVLGQLLDNGEDEDHVVQALESEPALSLLTFCVIVLHNGFTVTGQSACAAPENFNEEIGREIALRDAKAKIWPLLGYELRSQLAACEGP